MSMFSIIAKWFNPASVVVQEPEATVAPVSTIVDAEVRPKKPRKPRTPKVKTDK